MKVVVDSHGNRFEIPNEHCESSLVLHAQEEHEIFEILLPHSHDALRLFIEFLGLRFDCGPVEYSTPVPFDSNMASVLASPYCDFLIRIGNGEFVHELRKLARMFECEDLYRLMTVHVSRLCGIYSKEYMETVFHPIKIVSDAYTQFAMDPKWFDGTPFEREAQLRREALGVGITTIAEQDAYVAGNK